MINMINGLDLSEPGAIYKAMPYLESAGADLYDPVRFRYIGALAKRADGKPPRVAQALEEKALRELIAYRQELLAEHATLQDKVNALCKNEANIPLMQAFDTCDYRRVRQILALESSSCRVSPLKVLLEHMQQDGEPAPQTQSSLSFDESLWSQESFDGVSASAEANEKRVPVELKSMKVFRESWVKQVSDSRVTAAINDAPENPGPLNPQMLMIRSLDVMRDLSPQYLNRFVSYLDSLLWLEQAGEKLVPEKPSKADGKAKSRKRKS